jgi:ABC-type bacteriocin/lantibiotic exporter with double-glycine peptidase domain
MALPAAGRIPFRYQASLNDCAPACVRAICEYYGMDLSMAQLRARLAADPQSGVALASFENGLSDIFIVTCGRIESDPEASLYPFIAYLNGERHFVVVWSANARGVTVGDPSLGIYQQSWAEFRSRWNGLVVLLRPRELDSLPAGGNSQAKKASSVVLSLFAGRWSPLLYLSLLAALRGVTGTAFSVLFPYALLDMHRLLLLASSYLATSLVLTAAASYLSAAIRRRYAVTLGQKIIDKLQHVERRYFTVGDVFTRFQDLGNVIDVVTLLIRDVPYAAVLLLGAFAFLAREDILFAVALSAAMGIILVLLEPLIDRARSYFFAIRFRTSRLNNQLREFIDLPGSGDLPSVWRDLATATFKQSMWLVPVSSVISQALTVTIVVMASWELLTRSGWLQSGSDYASTLTLITIMNYLVAAMTGVYGAYVQWQTVKPAVHRLDDFLTH